MEEHVVLVDEQDREIGQMEKMLAHEKALLHRAFSVFVFNAKGELMLQQRALDKYHSGGLWTNTCCSHPRVGELPIEGAKRRLMEEMGFQCDLEKAFEFQYKAVLDQGLTEHEYDHVFFGKYEGSPELNPEEASDWKWIDRETLDHEIKHNPDRYTAWFKICYAEVQQRWK